MRCGLVVWAVILLAPITAAAQPPRAPVQLEWGEGVCLDGHDTEVRGRVEALLGRNLSDGTGAPITLDLLEPTAGSLDLTLRDSDGEVLGQRVLALPQECDDDTLDAIALVIAMLVDLGERTARLTLPEPVPAPTMSVAAPPPAARDRAPVRSEGPVGAVGGSVGGAYGVVDGLSLELGVYGRLSLASWLDLRLDVEAIPYAEVRDPRAGMEAGVVRASLLLCPGVAVEAAWFGLCAGAGGGLVWARGVDLDLPLTPVRPLGFARLMAVARSAIEALEIGLHVAVDVLFNREGFFYANGEGQPVVLRVLPQVLGSAGITLAWTG